MSNTTFIDYHDEKHSSPKLKASHYPDFAGGKHLGTIEMDMILQSSRNKSNDQVYLLLCASYKKTNDEAPDFQSACQVDSLDDISLEIEDGLMIGGFDRLDFSHLYHNGCCVAYVDINGAGSFVLRGTSESGVVFDSIDAARASLFGPSMIAPDGRLYREHLMEKIFAAPDFNARLEDVFTGMMSDFPFKHRSVAQSNFRSTFDDLFGGNVYASDFHNEPTRKILLSMCKHLSSAFPDTQPIISDVVSAINSFMEPQSPALTNTADAAPSHPASAFIPLQQIRQFQFHGETSGATLTANAESPEAFIEMAYAHFQNTVNYEALDDITLQAFTVQQLSEPVKTLTYDLVKGFVEKDMTTAPSQPANAPRHR